MSSDLWFLALGVLGSVVAQLVSVLLRANANGKARGWWP